MTDISHDFNWPGLHNSGFKPVRRKTLRWWRQPFAPRRLPLVMELLALLVALSVLLAFYQVVRTSVERGELLREARAVQALATHHCNTLSGLGAGDMCLARLNTPAASTPLRLKQQ